LYSGPISKEWFCSDGCEYNKGAIRFLGSGKVSWKVPQLPPNHRITWNFEVKSDTNIKIIIASDADEAYSADKSGYTLTLNQGSVQLTRNNKSGTTKLHIQNDQQFLSEEKKDNSLFIELRVDLDNRILQLLINGKILRHSIVDPEQNGKFPQGLNYHVICNGRDQDTYLRNFTVSKWNHHVSTSLSEDRGSIKTDKVYDIESNFFSGELVSISNGLAKNIIFSNPHSPNPIEIPLQSASILYFSGEATKPEGSFTIRISGGGTLRVKEYLFNEGLINAKHSILGDLVIPLTYVEEISRS
jgi:hypothetical protein